uniref:Uncharacterized protein n=1 Tax=Anguilla anguilla TaxID=7936 RepID=A0A0E9W3U5_ANGAN
MMSDVASPARKPEALIWMINCFFWSPSSEAGGTLLYLLGLVLLLFLFFSVKSV